MSQQHVQIVQSVYEAFNRGDIAAVLAAFDPQVELVEAESLPYAGVYRGHAGVQQMLVGLGAVWELFQSTLEQVVAHGDEVIVFLQIKGRLRGSERPIEMPVIEVWRIRDGLVAGVRPFYWDTGAIASAWAERRVLA